MTSQAIRRGWGAFTHGWYRSTDGCFSIFAVGWDSSPGGCARRRDGSRYGYDLYEGDEKRGWFDYVDGAMAEVKKLRSRG